MFTHFADYKEKMLRENLKKKKVNDSGTIICERGIIITIRVIIITIIMIMGHFVIKVL